MSCDVPLRSNFLRFSAIASATMLTQVILKQLRGRLALAVSGFEDDVGSAAEAASLVQVRRLTR